MPLALFSTRKVLRFDPPGLPSKGYVNAETKLETTLTVEYSYKYNFHSISVPFMATNALIFSLILLREEKKALT
jgi:hypothetical protein